MANFAPELAIEVATNGALNVALTMTADGAPLDLTGAARYLTTGAENFA